MYGPGALRWDSVSRAAGFVTPDDETVAAFARPLLVAFEAQLMALGRPMANVLQAMLLFEALKQHGVRYREDADTPYARVAADRAEVDHIQYPAQTLHSRAGDCDDLTVLYASLLHNANIRTALVDYPKHVFLLFDTGVSVEHAHRLPLDPRRYVARGGRLWIPVEVTLLKDSFHAAWDRGLEQVSNVSPAAIVATEDAWQEFEPAVPEFEIGDIPVPASADVEPLLASAIERLRAEVREHFVEVYLDPLGTEHDETLRLRMVRLYLRLRMYDEAISAVTTHLLQDIGDRAESYRHLGMAVLLKGDAPQAALHFQRAVEDNPDDVSLQRDLEFVLRKIGMLEAPDSQLPASSGRSRGAAEPPGVDDFSWSQ